MLINILMYLHHVTTFLFGIFVSASFLNIRMTRKNILLLSGFSLSVGMFYLFSYLKIGAEGTEQLFPFIIHLPLILFLVLCFRQRFLPSVLAVLTAYLCCQLSNWMGIAAQSLFLSEEIYYSVRVIVTLLIFILLIRYVSPAVAQIMQKSDRELLIFGLLPTVYYLFDYATTVYTSLLYSGKMIVTEFFGFVLSISFLMFLLLYFKQYEEKQNIENQNKFMQLKEEQSQKKYETIKRSKKELSLIRHDMRHFLSSIASFLENGETEKASAYIQELIESVDRTINKTYCSNNTVNMILSSYEDVLTEHAIDFQYRIQIPVELPFSDVDVTSLLSNAMENAITAVIPLPIEKRIIKLNIFEKNGKILISLSNTFAVMPLFADGMPISKEKKHGFGTQSIRYTAAKLAGNCQFSVKDEWFFLQIIL